MSTSSVPCTTSPASTISPPISAARRRGASKRRRRGGRRADLKGEAMNTFGDREEILKQAIDWRSAGKGVALATVVTTWGSSPRPVGAKLALEQGGGFIGSVSGGCVEGAGIEEGLKTITDGQPRLLRFGVTNDRAWG